MVAVAVIGKDLFQIGEPVLEKALRTFAVYGGIVVLLRLGGKRDLAQLNSFDLVVLLMLSNVVQNAVIGNDNSLVGGLLGALILVAANAAVVRLVRRSDMTARLFEGEAAVLVRDGRMERRTIERLGLRPEDVMTAVRRQGANTIGEVEHATIEPGGAILVKLRADAENATRGDLQRLEAKLDALIARASAS
jgi:uncharacterized membrane protein YcaP (DUF421 family)